MTDEAHLTDPPELLPDPIEAEFVEETKDGEPAGHIYHDDETDIDLAGAEFVDAPEVAP